MHKYDVEDDFSHKLLDSSDLFDSIGFVFLPVPELIDFCVEEWVTGFGSNVPLVNEVMSSQLLINLSKD